MPPVVVQHAKQLEARGLGVFFHDLTHDLRVPTAMVTIDDGTLVHFGCASHLRAGAAVTAALLEAAQSRITDLQGAREDLPERGARPAAWFTAIHPRTSAPADLAAAEAPAAGLDALETTLRRVGLEGPLVIDLSLPGVPLAVVRAIVPGLEQWALDPSRRGRRLRQWLQA
jgi:ribosomal protein S12 methylthiotransferase accessory factor